MAEHNQEKMSQLQNLEQNLQILLNQKQSFQSQLLEVDNALSELQKSPKSIYRIIGTIMLSSDQQSTIKELEERKKILELRIKSIEKQETSIKQKADKLQEELIKGLKS
ncbi:MAG TPA: prefoldin subunit beta [Candidatus Nanoarchaeia archaeon]|nr:prefoldin subunit beta [Candidatus Nanoarchaeia archaeon]